MSNWIFNTPTTWRLAYGAFTAEDQKDMGFWEFARTDKLEDVHFMDGAGNLVATGRSKAWQWSRSQDGEIVEDARTKQEIFKTHRHNRYDDYSRDVLVNGQVVARATTEVNCYAPDDYVLNEGDSPDNPLYTMSYEKYGEADTFCSYPVVFDIVNSSGHHVATVEENCYAFSFDEYAMTIEPGVNVSMIWALILCRAAMIKERENDSGNNNNNNNYNNNY
mmetsp:Transcript_33822/g.77201  ORF Transcript_33822/g.77201 Transcript_33822/m.77201 type:complete len:220 (-) Transcript_33822:78-737(-)